jgi:hypothetical protein
MELHPIIEEGILNSNDDTNVKIMTTDCATSPISIKRGGQ